MIELVCKGDDFTNYHNITHDDMINGNGLRVVLWVSGCSHHCYNCQNSQTWDANSGIPFDKNARQEIYEQLSKDYISGITLSGGDPLHKNNLTDIYNLVTFIKKQFPNKTIWIYTGYTWEEIMYGNNKFSDILLRQCILEKCDVMVDGKYNESLCDLNLKWRGSSNQRVIDIQQSLKENKVIALPDTY